MLTRVPCQSEDTVVTTVYEYYFLQNTTLNFIAFAAQICILLTCIDLYLAALHFYVLSLSWHFMFHIYQRDILVPIFYKIVMSQMMTMIVLLLFLIIMIIALRICRLGIASDNR